MVATIDEGETGKGPSEIEKVKARYFESLSDLNQQDIDSLDAFFKFTVVRNPIARVRSAYLDKIARSPARKAKYVRRKQGLSKNEPVSFDMFLDYLECGGIIENGHWSLQKDLLFFPVEQYEVIGKVENLQADLSLVFARIYGEDRELIKANKHKINRNELILSSDQKKRIQKIYQEDFELFGYPLSAGDD
ncbi:MAG: sulfotransferase family protein [Planctomycetaceae bacterium]|nr:sulfotransferase family protein [Planctomycetaceae bacterium]